MDPLSTRRPLRHSNRRRTAVALALLAVAALVAAGCVPTNRRARPSRRPRVSMTVPAAVTNTTVPTLGASTNGPLPAIPSGFDTRAYLEDQGFIPASTAAEPTGNFRVVCEFSHLAYDDPIVFPGQPGKSHLHMFFGNRTANASSTYESLRAAGDGTCNGGPLNRSGYWMPAVHDASGQVVVPDQLAVYYKGNIGAGPAYQAAIRAIQPFPAGLKMIAGYDMADPGPETHFNWYCEIHQVKSQTIPNCPAGEKLGAVIQFPSCWDGRNLDSADHRSHMAYLEFGDGGPRCPASHPVSVPQYTLGAWFTHDGNSANWYLDSDRMAGMTHANGTTFHADWFGAWDPAIQDTWMHNCVHGMLNCIDGQLGNGQRMRGAPDYRGPMRLPVPARP